MALKVTKVDTWSASLKDQPGGLASKLELLAKAGINLEFVIGRRAPDKPGQGVMFATPIKGAAAVRLAKAAGFAISKTLHTVRIEGPDKKGVGAKVTSALADLGLNLRGLSAAAINGKFVAHIAVDTAGDASKAIRVLKQL